MPRGAAAVLAWRSAVQGGADVNMLVTSFVTKAFSRRRQLVVQALVQHPNPTDQLHAATTLLRTNRPDVCTCSMP
jgi:hypothetical protein